MQDLTFKDITKRHSLEDSPLPNGTIVRIVHGGHTFSSYAKKFVEMNFPPRKEGDHRDAFPNGAEGLIMGHTKHCNRSDHYGWIYHIRSRDGNNDCLISGNGFVALGHVSSPHGQVWNEHNTMTLEVTVTSDLHLLERSVNSVIRRGHDARDYICASAHPHYDPSDNTLKGIITTDAVGGGAILIRDWYSFLHDHVSENKNHDSWNMLVRELRKIVGDHRREVGISAYHSNIRITADHTHMLMHECLAESTNPFRRNICAFSADGRLITMDRYIRKTVGVFTHADAAVVA